MDPKDKLVVLDVPGQTPEKLAFVKHQEGYDAVSFTDGYPEPYARISVALGDVKPQDGCFLLKDWSENSNLGNFLLKDGYLIETGNVYPSGYVDAKEVRPTPKFESVLCTSNDLDEIQAHLGSIGMDMD